MNCEWVKGNVTLYVYDELADDARYELEQHVERCTACAGELQSTREFKVAMTALPQLEPTPNLLASSRMRLQEVLETAEQTQGWRRLVFNPWAVMRRFSPALAMSIFMVGFFGGVGVTYKLVGDGAPAPMANQTISAPNVAQQAPAEASIVGIRGISQQPGSNSVEIKYDTLVPQQAQGSLDDPRIQQLLLYAARNNQNSGMRLDSLDLLTQKQDDARVRDLLVYALRNDSNPGVRVKSLESLGPYVKEDMNVRNAVLDALVNDTNPGVRNLALQLIRPVKADSSVRQVLQHLATKDSSESMRTQARSVLASVPQLD